MRSARVDDYWRRLCDENRVRNVKTLEMNVANVKGYGNCSVRLHHALTVLCGSSGVGKSTALSLCELALSEETVDPYIRQRHIEAEVTIRYSLQPDHTYVIERSRTRDQNNLGINPIPDVHRIDAGNEWFVIKQLVEKSANWDELLTQYAARSLGEKELRELRYITGKNYSSVEIYEIEDFGSIFPYCVATNSGYTYGFEEMGAGEGAIFLLWWRLKQIRTSAILLLEQPETHLSARSQLAIMNMIAEKCSSLACCIMTTHSSEIISYVPKQCLRLIVQDKGIAEVIDTPDEGQLRMLLGSQLRKSLLLLTEDRCARILATESIRVNRPDLLSQIHVADAGSESDVIAILSHMPKDLPIPGLLGLLDGDQRKKTKVIENNGRFFLESSRHPVDFLPGSTSPEAFLRNICCAKVDELAKAIGRSRSDLVAILSSIEGRDDHDWLEELSKQIGFTFDRCIATLFSVIQTDDFLKEDFRNLVERIAVYFD